MTIGTDLEMIPPASAVIAGADAERLPSLHTNATTDQELLVVWLRSHADGSPHTRRAYDRIGRRFLGALAASGANLRRHTIDDVHAALEAMRTRADGTTASGATVNTNVAAVKALLNFAHKVGFTRFNAAPLIKLKRVRRERAQRLLSEVDAHLLIRAAKSGRDRLLLQVAYYGALRVSELASLTWGQVLPRDTGEAQLAIVGSGDKPRNVLHARRCWPTGARVPDNGAAHQLHRAAARARQPRDRKGGADHARHKTTSVYAHAKPDDCSSRYLKRT